MDELTKIHASKQPRRPHFIKEWAELRGLKPVDLAKQLGADKSLVSRWFSGSTPGIEYQNRLASLFGCEPESIFRHPDDDWMTRFLRNRSREEIEQIKKTLEVAFPQKTGTGGKQ